MNMITYVYFYLMSDAPLIEGDVYIFGALSDWKCKEEFKMKYDHDFKGYRAVLFVKQGFYNYEYVTKNQRDLNFEMYLTPNSMPFFGVLFGHLTTYEKEKEPLTKFTAGIYFCKEKQPLNPSIGVNFIFTDIYDKHDLNNEKKFSINIATRLPLGRGVN